MSLDAGRDQLAGALKTMRGHWAYTAPYWHDVMKIQFVEQILTPLEDQAVTALEAIDRMDGILRQMRRDCESSHYDIHADE